MIKHPIFSIFIKLHGLLIVSSKRCAEYTKLVYLINIHPTITSIISHEDLTKKIKDISVLYTMPTDFTNILYLTRTKTSRLCIMHQMLSNIMRNLFMHPTHPFMWLSSCSIRRKNVQEDHAITRAAAHPWAIHPFSFRGAGTALMDQFDLCQMHTRWLTLHSKWQKRGWWLGERTMVFV